MTHRTIWRSSRPVDNRGKLEPMRAVEAEAWRLTRERFPWLYERKGNGNG
jgi:hypothetical protein